MKSVMTKINRSKFDYLSQNLLRENIIKRYFKVSFYLLSKQVEHNKCPFFLQNVFVDLSISFLHIKHLKIETFKSLFRIRVFLLIIKIEAN